MLEAARLISSRQHVSFKMVVPGQEMAALARELGAGASQDIEIQIGRLEEALSQATVALASTGTVTLECAWFGVPAVAMYKTSLWTYWIARQVVTVQYLSLPNLLANEALYPEFIQGKATAANVAGAAIELLDNPARRAKIQTELARVMAALGGPGAAKRAAAAILSLPSHSGHK
jgi:lipid-A-disaccharide synthase